MAPGSRHTFAGAMRALDPGYGYGTVSKLSRHVADGAVTESEARLLLMVEWTCAVPALKRTTAYLARQLP